MSEHRRTIMPGSCALLLMAALSASGCPRESGGTSAVTDPAPPATLPSSAPSPSQPPPAPPPSELDLTLESARAAQAGGNSSTAIALYRKAAGLTQEGSRLADIHYALAMLQADPANPQRNLEESRLEMQRFLIVAGEDPRVQEGRVTKQLLDEATNLRAEVASLRSELDAFGAEVARLKAELAEKEKELEGIKKVLLRSKTKP